MTISQSLDKEEAGYPGLGRKRKHRRMEGLSDGEAGVKWTRCRLGAVLVAESVRIHHGKISNSSNSW